MQFPTLVLARSGSKGIISDHMATPCKNFISQLSIKYTHLYVKHDNLVKKLKDHKNAPNKINELRISKRWSRVFLRDQQTYAGQNFRRCMGNRTLPPSAAISWRTRIKFNHSKSNDNIIRLLASNSQICSSLSCPKISTHIRYYHKIGMNLGTSGQ